MNRRRRAAKIASIAPARRRCLVVLAAGLLGLAGVDAFAQTYTRMEPDQRERLRQELRRHGEQARGASDPSRARGRDDGRDGTRMSAPEREQLRRQLREARPDERRGSGRRRD